MSSSASKWSTLLIFKNNASAIPGRCETNGTLKDPYQGQDGKCQSGPMNEGIVLMIIDRKERPRDRDGGREITFRRRERVGRGSTLKEEPVRWENMNQIMQSGE